nr:hypothetical protein Ccrd_010332 [Tanacetum cinerariifolium]
MFQVPQDHDVSSAIPCFLFMLFIFCTVLYPFTERHAQPYFFHVLIRQTTTEYQEAIQATEDIEPPAVGFAKTADYKGGESNLLITMAITGRLSNTSYIGFQYSVENVMDHLTTNGITAIPGERRSIEELEGMSWNLKPPEQTSVRVPSRVAVNEILNRSVKEVTATDWGEEFSDDEVTTGKVTILSEVKEESDWDDDERNAQIIKKHKEHAFPTAADDAESSTSYQPPPDAIMGPAVYPPARQNPQQTYRPDYQFGYPQGKGNTFYGGYGEYHNSQWTLPPAWMESGVMLVLPADPGLWSDVISR